MIERTYIDIADDIRRLEFAIYEDETSENPRDFIQSGRLRQFESLIEQVDNVLSELKTLYDGDDTRPKKFREISPIPRRYENEISSE